MRSIRYGLTTLLIAGLASLTYARVPAPAAASPSGNLLVGPNAASAPYPGQEKPKAEAKPAQAPKPAMHPQKEQKVDKKQQKAEKKQDKKQAKEARKDHKQQAGAKRIPDRVYKAHFGQQHRFAARKVITTRTIVPNQTRFAYSGYTFIFLQPWPMGWGWDDDVYIDYMGDGYYLMDPMHPGIQVGLSIGF
mgnify:CR=1 FL=1